MYRIEERDEVVKLKQELLAANSKLDEQAHSAEVDSSAVRQMHLLQEELDRVRSDLETVKIDRDEARSELNANADASATAAALRHQMDHYPLLVKVPAALFSDHASSSGPKKLFYNSRQGSF